MISYIKGKIEYISENYIIVENNGIGYRIYVSSATLSKFSQQEQIKVYTYMNVKEDGIELYGFFNTEEIGMFNRLISVSGIGPKGAQSMLNILSPAEIALAVVTEDALTLSRPAGVGKKTAQRIILELKDKVKTQEAVFTGSQGNVSHVGGEKQDAIDALVSLGYGKSEAVKTVMQVTDGADLSLENVIRLSLKKLSQ